MGGNNPWPRPFAGGGPTALDLRRCLCERSVRAFFIAEGQPWVKGTSTTAVGCLYRLVYKVLPRLAWKESSRRLEERRFKKMQRLPEYINSVEQLHENISQETLRQYLAAQLAVKYWGDSSSTCISFVWEPCSYLGVLYRPCSPVGVDPDHREGNFAAAPPFCSLAHSMAFTTSFRFLLAYYAKINNLPWT